MRWPLARLRADYQVLHHLRRIVQQQAAQHGLHQGSLAAARVGADQQRAGGGAAQVEQHGQAVRAATEGAGQFGRRKILPGVPGGRIFRRGQQSGQTARQFLKEGGEQG